jgi:hypothetical protein
VRETREDRRHEDRHQEILDDEDEGGRDPDHQCEQEPSPKPRVVAHEYRYSIS